MTHLMTTYADWTEWAAEGWTMMPYITKSDEGPYHGGLPLSWDVSLGAGAPTQLCWRMAKAGDIHFWG